MKPLAELIIAVGVIALLGWIMWPFVPRKKDGEKLPESWRGWKRGGDGR